MKLIVAAPLRVCLGGGSTDIPEYYSLFGGWICSVAINKYVTVTFDDFGPRRTVPHDNSIVEACCQKVHMPKCAIGVESDVFPGSGLGGSGALAVATTAGLMTIQHYILNQERWVHRSQLNPLLRLIQKAYVIERSICSYIGVQDSMIAAHGGCICYSILRDGTIWNVHKPPINFAEMAEWLLLFRTPLTRQANTPLADLSNNMRHTDIQNSLHHIRAIGIETIHAAVKRDWLKVGDLFHEHWVRKKSTAASISNTQIDAWYDAAMTNGALGGKLCGAGAGGYFIFVCRPDNRERLITAMRAVSVEHVPIFYGTEGVRFRWTS